MSIAARMTAKEVDKKLGEFHGELFDFCDAAHKAGDEVSHAVAAYVHDKLCVFRCSLTGETADGDYAPYPKFRKRGKS